MTGPSDAPHDPGQDKPASRQFVTVTVADQLFGLPIERVHDVFVIRGITHVPLAPPEIAGLVNLRGRIVTAVDLRVRLGWPAGQGGSGRMAVGLEAGSEHYGLLVDEVGEVLHLGSATRDDNPIHLGGRCAELSAGIHRLADRLLVVLDVDRLLSRAPAIVAA